MAIARRSALVASLALAAVLAAGAAVNTHVFEGSSQEPDSPQQVATQSRDAAPATTRSGLPADPQASRSFADAPVQAPEIAGSESPVALQATTQPALSAFGLPCAQQLSARPAPGGMIALELSAPCQPERLFTVTQGPLGFTGRTSVTGAYSAMVPALGTAPALAIRFEDGSRLATSLQVEEAALYDRVILQWEGEAGLSIHALEFGAQAGEAGHVSAATPRDPGFAARALGGFLTALGTPGLEGAGRAEVYSFPSGLMGRSGLVRLNVEAEVTEANCGRILQARSSQIRGGQAEPEVHLELAMPDCSAVGDFLVLKNLLRDLKIARN